MNRMKTTAMLAAVLAVLTVYTSCKKDPPAGGGNGGGTDTGMVAMTAYTIPTPVRFPEPEPIPEDNKMYVERIYLGRMLFYDNRLSNNGESCNTCHAQSQGFAIDGVSQFDKGLTALPLVNLAWYKNFMWSGRIQGSLEDVMLAEITKRFNTDLDKINAIGEYRKMFKDYYGVQTITSEDLARALAQFMRSIVSRNTKFDRYILGSAQLTPLEQAGERLFFSESGDCFHCHVMLITTDNSLRVNGLDSVYKNEIDNGYYNVSKNPADYGKFRTPNLRNIALKHNFMHDGRFKTLREVVEFYNSDVHRGVPNIDPVMVKPIHMNGLQLDSMQIESIVAFLGTFTDEDMIKDTAYSDPWKR